ncbi:phosphotransferase [Undibacterium sp. Jales W-56]|uniref:aminoglycoside phosphotransferase family protein n=1 Tax=Undibacterium sp. Jales W-56 TaxID=2897325 RepID=UPI0021CF28C4|nr:phosphotransferase [Undibacterium sp. Jales W-56]MCU6432478.1 phosphotransferase [Undibacterium sp. Jales W-56]
MSTSSENQRMSAIHAWLASISSPSLRVDSLRPASEDASFRRYFRIDGQNGKTYIVMDAPQPAEDVRPFIRIAELLAKINLSVPDILAQDVEQGLLLLTDLGSTTYFNALNHDTAHKLYMDAIDSLILLQTQSQPEVLPEYDREFLLRELMIFPEWYIAKHLGVTLSAAQTESLNKVFEALLANIMAQPQVYVHRDYHSRNLMVLDKGNPGILDFQGALYGPLTYDLVSLLRDAYVQWDEEMVLDWAIRYWEKARRAGLPVNTDVDSFYRDFEFMGLQRHLKVLGIFARLSHRDGKDHYLADMPLVMEYVRKTANRYHVLIPLLRLLDEIQETAPTFGYTF